MAVKKRGARYQIAVDLGRGARGERRRYWATFATEDEARAEEERVRARHTLGQLKDPSRMTVAQYLERWLEYKEPKVVPATYVRYKGQVAVLSKALGVYPLAKLTPLHITHFEAALYKQGLSDSTVRKYRMVLQGALRVAVKWRLLGENPCAMLDPLPENSPEVRWLSASEQAALLKAARFGFKGRESRIYVAILLALATGVRRGELLALRWSDIDLNAGKVAVRRGLQWTPYGPRYRKGGKSGERIVALPETLLPVLAEYRRKRAADRALAGKAWKDQGLVFSDDTGQPWNVQGFRSSFRYLCRRAKLPADIHFHCLRHTFATELLLAGVHPKIVSEALGHASVRMTLDRYSHAVPHLQDEAAALLDLRLRALLGEDIAAS